MKTTGIWRYVLLVMFLAGCRAEEYSDASGTDVILQVQNIVFMQEESDAKTRAEADITADEGRVNDLWFLAYPVDGQGEKLVRRLSSNDALSSEEYKAFALRIQAGTYRVYVAANLPGVHVGIGEDELKNIVLRFREGNVWALPETAKGLPMFYAFPDAISISVAEGKTLQADLTILCAKLSYTLMFDNTGFSQASYGSNGFRVTGISVGNIAESSSLTNETAHVSDLGDYDCTVSGNTGSGQWRSEYTIYLPEHYTDDADKRTVLWIEGTETVWDGSAYKDIAVEHTFCLPLGGGDYTGDNGSQGGNLVRGTWYDVTAQIVGKGEQDITVSVDKYPWTTDNLSLGFAHTELWLSRTGIPDVSGSYNVEEQILVTSLDKAQIEYSTTASSISVECMDKIGEKAIVLAAVGQRTITFSVNPDIPVASYGHTSGTAQVAIQANNIIKYVDVQYDVTPILEVSPLLINIQTEEGGAGVQREYIVNFETNLGGIILSATNLTAPSGKGSVSVSCNDTQAMTGQIILKTNGESESTWESSFTVKSAVGNLERSVRIVVNPPLNDYVIHFIAINDDCDINDSNRSQIHKELFSNGKATDGWTGHNIYIYTQYGVTADGDIPKSVWYFFDTTNLMVPFWPGVSMQNDPNNAGWLYYKLPIDEQGRDRDNYPTDKLPKPGETLIMFNSGSGTGVTNEYRHRYPYHMEPGVMLFDFAGREGWFVFDPTSNAYEFWEEKPELYLATFTMYTKDTDPVIDNWYRSYGVQPESDGTMSNLLIWGDKDSHVDDYYNMRVYEDSGIDDWKKTELDLWSIKGREGKDIIVKNKAEGDDNRYGILFGGRVFKNNTGYYDNGWHEGVPQ